MKKIELKAKTFAKSYAKHKLNGTEAAMEVYNPANRNVANNIASDNLRKPIFLTAIIEELEKQGLNDEHISEVHKRNIDQSKNYAASNTGIEIYHKLKGNFAPERTEQIKLNINVDNPEDIQHAINQLLQEIKQLNEPNEVR